MCVEQLAIRTRSNTSGGVARALQLSKVVDEISSRMVRRMLEIMKYRNVGAIRDVSTADHKAKRITWCLEEQRQLIVNPNLLDDWLITDELRILLDRNNVP